MHQFTSQPSEQSREDETRQPERCQVVRHLNDVLAIAQGAAGTSVRPLTLRAHTCTMLQMISDQAEYDNGHGEPKTITAGVNSNIERHECRCGRIHCCELGRVTRRQYTPSDARTCETPRLQ